MDVGKLSRVDVRPVVINNDAYEIVTRATGSSEDPRKNLELKPLKWSNRVWRYSAKKDCSSIIFQETPHKCCRMDRSGMNVHLRNGFSRSSRLFQTSLNRRLHSSEPLIISLINYLWHCQCSLFWQCHFKLPSTTITLHYNVEYLLNSKFSAHYTWKGDWLAYCFENDAVKANVHWWIILDYTWFRFPIR